MRRDEGRGNTINLGAPFDRLTTTDAIQKHHPGKFGDEQLHDRKVLLERLEHRL